MTERAPRISRSYRLSDETVRLIDAVVIRLTEKDGVRKATATEVIERGVRLFAEKMKVEK